MPVRSLLAVFLTVACTGVSAAQTQWTSKVLHAFTADEVAKTGFNPRLGVLVVGNVMYGLTNRGGSGAGGVVYRRNANGTITTLRNFINKDTAADGCGYSPSGKLVIFNGSLFGTTFLGGQNGGGVIFRLSPPSSGSEWTCTPIKKFANRGDDSADGYGSFGGLLLHPADNFLYGTTQSGGTFGAGVIFRVNRNGQNYEVLYNFAKSGDGGYGSAGPLAVAADGRMYGATFFGGTADGGTVYRISRGGAFRALFQFNKNNPRKGYQPTQGPLLIDDANGLLYGATTLGGCPQDDTNCSASRAVIPAGVLFSVNLSGRGYKVLNTFDSDETSNKGYGPYGGLIMAPSGVIYGVAQSGGNKQSGVAFRFFNGNYSVIRHFNIEVDGATPSGALAFKSGDLIGTNTFGGVNGGGVLFQLQAP